MKHFLTFIVFLLTYFISYCQNDGAYECSHQKILAASLHPVSPMDKINDMNAYDIKYHKLDLSVSNTSTYIEGSVITKAQVVVPNFDTYIFELHPSLTIDSILFNGQSHTWDTSGVNVIVNISNVLQLNDLFTAQVFYHGTPSSTSGAAIGNGINNAKSPTWGNWATWTLSQPYSAYVWWPCKQALADKIDSVDIHLTVNDTLRAGSNGLLVNTVALPGNKVRYEWKTKYPISYYLISFSVARYVVSETYANPQGQPPVYILDYVYDNPQTLPFFQDSIAQTAQFIEKFSELFGPYPFTSEKYGHCMAPLNGGMEHQTMTTQGTFNFTLTSHELTHQWFGDHVTCFSWKDIWINEGFATYGSFLAYEFLRPGSEKIVMNDHHEAVLSEPGGGVYVHDTASVGRIFDYRLTYRKGAAIIHSLRFVINNDSIFFAGLKKFQQDYAFGNSSGDLFRQTMEQVSGLNLWQFFNQWYFGEGYPTISLRWNLGNNQLFLKLSQTTSIPWVTDFFSTPLEIKIFTTSGDTTVRLNFTQNDQLFVLPFNKTITGYEIDPNQYILNKTGSIIQDNSLGIWELKKDSIFIYPNPVTDLLQIRNMEEGSLIKITDMNGKIVFEQKSNSSNLFIETDKWAHGTYVIQVQGNQKQTKGKILKN
jgi:aminopeptidase N